MNKAQESTEIMGTGMVTHTCPACGEADLAAFFEMPQVPVNCIALWPTRGEALACPAGSIELAFCHGCGAISNTRFDLRCIDYDNNYDNSLHFSPVFQKYADGLAHDLIERYDLRGKDIIEIGCGKGEFLAMLCQMGGNHGVGFDPTFVVGRADTHVGRGITIIPDFYSDRHAGYVADFLVCRHVLEHIPEPLKFLQSVRRAIGDRKGTVVFFEVPDALFTLRQMGIWDIIYEHCLYYTPGSLARLFATCGFDVLDLRESFGGQYVCLAARPTVRAVGSVPDGMDSPSSVAADLACFADSFRNKVNEWATHLRSLRLAGKRIALWGAGAKGAMFLNRFRNISGLDYIVDINPHKHGRFVPGTGQQVVAPEFLREYRPDVLVILNANYCDEIARTAHGMGLDPELILV